MKYLPDSRRFEVRSRPMDASYMALAAAEAEKYLGATAPNPAVGACLVKEGRILAVGAHKRAGTDHAEVVAMKDAIARHGAVAVRGATLYTTLEPCHHHGKRPPCTKAILEAGIARVVIAVAEVNKLASGGADALRAAGVQVDFGVTNLVCDELVRGFFKWITTGRPWIVHKLAYRITNEGALSMIPETGSKTFTTQESLRLAHLERRKSDALLTSLATVVADNPSFNVRHVDDHDKKTRLIAVITRGDQQPPAAWLKRQAELGQEVLLAADVDEALKTLGERGVHRVLIEAGPRLSDVIAQRGLWDERLIFIRRQEHDQVLREFKCLQA